MELGLEKIMAKRYIGTRKPPRKGIPMGWMVLDAVMKADMESQKIHLKQISIFWRQ